MTALILARDLVKGHEGMKDTFRFNAEGVATIGYGRNIRTKGLSEKEAEYLLENDLVECLEDLASFPWWNMISEERQAALLDMRFNLGSAGFRGFRKMIAAIEEQDYSEAAVQMLDSTWARVMKRRAQELSAIMRFGEIAP